MELAVGGNRCFIYVEAQGMEVSWAVCEWKGRSVSVFGELVGAVIEC